MGKRLVCYSRRTSGIDLLNNLQANIRCPVCKETERFDALTHENRRVITCRRCNLFFYEVMPTFEELNRHYQTYSYHKRVPVDVITKYSFIETIDFIKNLSELSELRILDFGCGQGDFLKAASEKNISAHGLEFSSGAVELCHEEGLQCSLSRCFKEAREIARENGVFNVITAFEVIEHLTDPLEFLEFSRDMLPKGGLLLITTPNAMQLEYYISRSAITLVYPEHLCAFQRRTFSYLAPKLGMSLVSIETRGSSLTLLRSLRKLLAKVGSELNARSPSKGKRDMAFGESSGGRPLVVIPRSIAWARRLGNGLFRATGMGNTLRVIYRKC